MVGTSVGATEGFIDGRARGCVDGTADRRTVGVIVGNLVGIVERGTLGDNEGEITGDVGKIVGEREGCAVVGRTVGNFCETEVGWLEGLLVASKDVEGIAVLEGRKVGRDDGDVVGRSNDGVGKELGCSRREVVGEMLGSVVGIDDEKIVGTRDCR